MQVTEYEPASGWLLGVWTCGGDEDIFDFPHVQGRHDGAVEYVETGAAPPRVRPRPKQNTRQGKTRIKADGQDLMRLDLLPSPCRVEIGPAVYEVEDGALDWGTLLPGEHHIRVEAFPFLDWEGTVRAG